MTVTVPVDAVDLVVTHIKDRIIPAALPGWTVGAKITAGVTPNKYIRVSLGSSAQLDRLGDRAEVRIQVWLDGSEKARTQAALIVLAHLQAGLVARKSSGPVTLPDPADLTKSLSQFTVSLPPLIGAQQ